MNENSSYIISPLMQGFNIDYCFMKITVMRLSLFIFIIVILFVQAKPTNLEYSYKWFQRQRLFFKSGY